MKKRFKKFGIILTSALLIAGATYFSTGKLIDNVTDTPLKSTFSAASSVAKVGGAQTEISLEDTDSKHSILATLHKMTHQKVAAGEKWGAVEMTDENIQKALDAVKTMNHVESDEIIEMVERWQQGDFSRIDDDHNFIWKLQGGSIGKAYGIMTEEQEKEFIQKNFK